MLVAVVPREFVILMALPTCFLVALVVAVVSFMVAQLFMNLLSKVRSFITNQLDDLFIKAVIILNFKQKKL